MNSSCSYYSIKAAHRRVILEMYEYQSQLITTELSATDRSNSSILQQRRLTWRKNNLIVTFYAIAFTSMEEGSKEQLTEKDRLQINNMLVDLVLQQEEEDRLTPKKPLRLPHLKGVTEFYLMTHKRRRKGSTNTKGTTKTRTGPALKGSPTGQGSSEFHGGLTSNGAFLTSPQIDTRSVANKKRSARKCLSTDLVAQAGVKVLETPPTEKRLKLAAAETLVTISTERGQNEDGKNKTIEMRVDATLV